jgi:hypothetical protein
VWLIRASPTVTFADPAGFHVVSIWESKARSDRFEAERLFTVFNKLNIPVETLMATTAFTTFDIDYFAVHATPLTWSQHRAAAG